MQLPSHASLPQHLAVLVALRGKPHLEKGDALIIYSLDVLCEYFTFDYGEIVLILYSGSLGSGRKGGMNT